jgi:hypothetical protein
MTEPEARQRVRIEISLELLHQMLRLPRGTELVGVEPGSEWRGTITLLASSTDAPKTARHMQMTYHHADTWPDPIQLIAVEWLDENFNEVVPS